MLCDIAVLLITKDVTTEPESRREIAFSVAKLGVAILPEAYVYSPVATNAASRAEAQRRAPEYRWLRGLASYGHSERIATRASRRAAR
jgi:hypothetical protein